MIRKSVLPLCLMLGACATGPQPADEAALQAQSAAASRLESDRAVAATLRRITSRVQKGEAAQARREYEERAAANPKDAHLKLFVHWTGAPGEQAWQEINSLAKLNPEDPWLWTALGSVYLQWRGFLDQANGEFGKALRLRPDFVPAQVGLAEALRLGGKLPEARSAFEAVLARVPDWQEALSGLGLTLRAMGDAGARAPLERALAIDPDDLRAVKALAEIALEAKETDRAIELQSKLLEFDPLNAQARVAVANMRLQKGDLAGAAADFEKAMEIAPTAEIARALADAVRQLNRPDDELRVLERLAQLDEADASPLLRMAELRAAEKDLEGAELALRQASDRKPDDAAIHLAVARNVRQREDYVAAIEAYRLARDKGAAEAAGELAELEKEARLPARPLKGSVQWLYGEVFAQVKKEFAERQKLNRNLGGKYGVKVTIGQDQRAARVELIEDTVHDAVLGALVYFSFKDAAYPSERPRTVTFEFVLAGAR